jgi:hypothetical protein
LLIGVCVLIGIVSGKATNEGKLDDSDKGVEGGAYIDGLSSSSCSMRSLTMRLSTRSFPPDDSVWSGKAPSRTNLIDQPWERMYLISLILQRIIREYIT